MVVGETHHFRVHPHNNPPISSRKKMHRPWHAYWSNPPMVQYQTLKIRLQRYHYRTSLSELYTTKSTRLSIRVSLRNPRYKWLVDVSWCSNGSLINLNWLPPWRISIHKESHHPQKNRWHATPYGLLGNVPTFLSQVAQAQAKVSQAFANGFLFQDVGSSVECTFLFVPLRQGSQFAKSTPIDVVSNCEASILLFASFQKKHVAYTSIQC